MGRACSISGGEERMLTRFYWRNLRERDHLKDPGVDGRIILKRIFEKWNGRGIEWINLAQDRDRRQAVVNTVKNVWVP
jgi:hypothetical protein